MTDYRITILTPTGSGLARKHIFPDGTIRQADNIAKFFHTTADISTPEKALVFLPKGMAYFLLAPFPWMLGSIRQVLDLFICSCLL